ncbi:hypothetical protein C8Q74DRAFT_835501 [Fomes fomentarius]|nr:hypothetical protein C8Q74DRAFT_835501 [Fomes fomentarius]
MSRRATVTAKNRHHKKTGWPLFLKAVHTKLKQDLKKRRTNLGPPSIQVVSKYASVAWRSAHAETRAYFDALALGEKGEEPHAECGGESIRRVATPGSREESEEQSSRLTIRLPARRSARFVEAEEAASPLSELSPEPEEGALEDPSPRPPEIPYAEGTTAALFTPPYPDASELLHALGPDVDSLRPTIALGAPSFKAALQLQASSSKRPQENDAETLVSAEGRQSKSFSLSFAQSPSATTHWPLKRFKKH